MFSMSQPKGGAPVLMVVHAHPDDESSQTGGTLARYAAAGCYTVLITCTDGGQGDGAHGVKPNQPGHDPHEVAARRSQELDRAAAMLGVSVVVKLGYPDSGSTTDGEQGAAADSFSRRALRPMVTRLIRLMRRYQPDVVVTYPPNGLSGHPDHIRTHDLVVAAHTNVVANCRHEAVLSQAADSLPLGPKLYYIALSATWLRAAQTVALAVLGTDEWVPPDEMAVDDQQITTLIDVAPFWADKLRAISAHANQSDAAALLQVLSAAGDLAEVGGRVEEYVRVYPPAVGPLPTMEHDFFESVGP
jgi:LmbE family N-acetylglucosaminyl deacetylase